MDLSAAIFGRRSTRAYTKDAVGEEVLTELIRAATFAPSAMNEQPCHFTVVTQKPLLARISKAAKAYAFEEFGKGPHIDHLREVLSDPEFDIFYEAPVLVVISAPATAQWVVEDCALAAQNLMLAAAERKLGSCWIGFAQSWLGTEDGRSAIGLPETLMPVAPIILGHPHGEAPPVPRRPPHIHWLR